ncbi:CdaR family transcriptional regulator [Paenibacillus xylanilyticus]|uniref:Sugar diacid utilization regulator n=1 Tax=Paenibacillus xylanilyticus TaxID=248903 RepID=A0A7Y6C0H1_9BACL|nr:sugar diacid recognition domain-containing protein [Paenibacillus xylanilyticus]NUU77329.1 sugar diacid utilization regulator [Paenibacillus xylanilyticus]
MLQLTEKQAQEIVDKMMQDIPYNINIMNEEGIIIGSGQKERVGTVHQGAVRALTTGSRIEVWQDGRLEKMGTNEPIGINNQHVGVIGISGHPDEVRPFCNIVRTTVSLLIEQRNQLENLAHEASRKKAFLERLLNHSGSYSMKFRKEAWQYNLDLQLPTVLLYMRALVNSPEFNEEFGKVLLKFPSFSIEDEGNAHIVMIQSESDLDPLVQQLQLEQPHCFISVSRREPNIAVCYEQARSAMNILLALQPAATLIRYDEVQFLVQFSKARLTSQANIVSRLEDHADLLDTLRSFIHHNGSMTTTATDLNIHRNTLQYRLKRIQSVTGRDPRNLLELIELTHGLLAFYQ